MGRYWTAVLIQKLLPYSKIIKSVFILKPLFVLIQQLSLQGRVIKDKKIRQIIAMSILLHFEPDNFRRTAYHLNNVTSR